MGAASCAADEIVLTSHSPGDFDPEEIGREVQAGMTPSIRPQSRIVADRREAIAGAIRDAGCDDVVLITGRGDEAIQFVGDEQIPLLDRDVAIDALKYRVSPS